MPGYLNQNGNSIGSLLRFIQEQKSQSPIIPPATETGSPIRGVVQEPLENAESIGTTHVASIKPEAVTEIGQAQNAIAPAGIEPAVAPVGVPGPVAPTVGANPMAANPTVRGETRSMSSDVSTPTIKGETRSAVPQQASLSNYEPVSLGTKITTGQVMGASTKAPQIPKNSVIGQAIAGQGNEPQSQSYGTPNIAQSGARVLASALGEAGRNVGNALNIPQVGFTSALRNFAQTPANNNVLNSALNTVTNTASNAVKKTAQKIAPVISQSPWSWVGKKTGWW